MHIVILIAAFVSMECVAWFTHKYIMHGLLWHLHKDHHLKEDEGFFEKNDFFFLVFALPGIALFLISSLAHIPILRWVAIGITLYGLAYFLVHDVFIHQRFRLFRHSNSIYLRAIRRAHKMHHKHLGKADGECFGMLFVPFKYFREAMRAEKKQAAVHERT